MGSPRTSTLKRSFGDEYAYLIKAKQGGIKEVA